MLSTPRSGEAGFTFSELALVLVVFAGLIAIVIVSVSGIDDDSAERECRTELRAIKAATERFNAEIGFYPPNDDALDFNGYLPLDESPNYEVVTPDKEGAVPEYRPVGDRCA